MTDLEELIELEKNDFGTKIAGIVSFVALFVFGGFWLYYTELSGAVIIQGKVDIMGEAKIVQHRDGGIVSSIRVEPGQSVKKGQLLIELDVAEYKIRANATAEKMKHLSARLYRLHAERRYTELKTGTVVTPAKINFKPANDELSRERELLIMREKILDAKRRQGEFKLQQLDRKAAGLETQLAAKRVERQLLNEEYDAKKDLLARGYSSLASLRDTQIRISLLDGAIGKMTAEKASTENQVGELKVSIENEKAEFRESVLGEIISIEAQIRDLKKNFMTDKTNIDRASIRAPVSGTIHKMEVFTERGVITPSQELMHIVPENSDLEIGGALETKHIDDVSISQSAVVRLSGFDARDTSELNAVVRWISPDVITDPKTGAVHYKIKVTVSKDEIQKANIGKLVPGMPAEIFVSTGNRTAYQYLTAPLLDQLRRAFKE